MPGSGFTCARSDLTGSKRRSRHSGASPASAAAKGSADWSGSARRWQGRTWSSTYTPRHDTPADSSRTTNGRRAAPTGTSPRPASPASPQAPGTHTRCASPGFARRARGSSQVDNHVVDHIDLPGSNRGLPMPRALLYASNQDGKLNRGSLRFTSVRALPAGGQTWTRFPHGKTWLYTDHPQVHVRRLGHDQLHREESLVRFWHSRPPTMRFLRVPKRGEKAHTGFEPACKTPCFRC